MPPVTIHHDNSGGLADPHLWVGYDGASISDDVPATATDGFGPIFTVDARRPRFWFKLKTGPGQAGPWEGVDNRLYEVDGGPGRPEEAWCLGANQFVYRVEPRPRGATAAAAYLAALPARAWMSPARRPWAALGAAPLADDTTLFGLYHPTAARVYVAGDFNDWQSPASPSPDPGRFAELDRFDDALGGDGLWLGTASAAPGAEYKLVVLGGTGADQTASTGAWVVDPFARRLGPSFRDNNCVVVDPTSHPWKDGAWSTPRVSTLILYELSVYGITEGDPGVPPADQGSFRGLEQRIRARYFSDLGVTALSIMPLAETPSMQSPTALGYDPSLFCTVERDFGTPDELRSMVDEAHRAGLAVLLDEVFNHTSSDFNPMWRLVLEAPSSDVNAGGLYFNGGTPWGNRIATERAVVQDHLIEACHRALEEYHADGFRFDATNTWYMDHTFLHRLAADLKATKPDVLLVAENLPNERDLDLQGFDGYAQWCDQFHDRVLDALLERGGRDALGDALYFSKGSYASHSNNVVNYIQSHDEDSVAAALGGTPMAGNPLAEDRKGRLGVLATVAAVGQPMLYMGQELNAGRPRNVVTVDWPADVSHNAFLSWTSALLALRRRYAALRLEGYDPAADGQFTWILGPWLDASHGGGRSALGWRAEVSAAEGPLIVLLNLEPFDVQVDLELGRAGTWIKLADIESVNDAPPGGTNGPLDPTALRSLDGRFGGFTLPSSSGFVYRWIA